MLSCNSKATVTTRTMLRAAKNRFGLAELGIYEMTGKGLPPWTTRARSFWANVDAQSGSAVAVSFKACDPCSWKRRRW